MRRRIIPTRLLALTLAFALFLGNDYTIFPLAEVKEQTSSINNVELTEPQPITTEIGGEPIVQSDETPASTNGDNGTSNDDNGTSNGDNGTSNDDNGTSNDDNGTSNDDNGTSNDDNGTSNDDNGTSNGDNGTSNGDNGTSNGDNGTSNGDNGTSNDNNNECQVSEDGKHHWVEDTENGGEKCEACGISKPDGEDADDENLDDKPEYSDVCPKNPDGKHLWLVTSNTCIYCGIEKPKEDPVPVEPECEHEFDGNFDPETGDRTCIKCGEVIPCDHHWVTDPETGLTTCINCGIEKPEEEEECEHEWVTDPETGLTTCIKCGIEKPEEEECEHEWIRDSETLEVVCRICGELNVDYVEEDPCPESKWGFHIYAENEDGTGYVCVLCGAEKEELDPLDVTEEMFMNSRLAIATLAAWTSGRYDSMAYSTLPKTPAELQQWIDEGNYTLLVATLGDLLALQECSKFTDFKGFTIQIATRMTGSVEQYQTTAFWNLVGTNGIGLADDDVTPMPFTGLGTPENPFRGTFVTGAEGINFSLGTPLFEYLDVEATIGTDKWDVNFNGDITSGNAAVGILAGTLVKTAEDDQDIDCVDLNRVTLGGSVTCTNSAGAAGLIFGKVVAEEGTSITLPYDNTDIKLGSVSKATVTGHHAGGFTGETQGDVTVHIKDSGIIHDVQVIASYGSSVGTINEYNKLTWSVAAAGMFVGAMEKGKLLIEGNSEAYKTYVDGSIGCNGGFVGMAIGGTEVTTKAGEDGSLVSVVKASTPTYGVYGYMAGGILGYYEHPEDVNKKLLTLEDISVSAYIYGYSYSAGGVLGRYYRNIDGVADEATRVDDTIDNITVSGSVRASTNGGGVVGLVHGSNLVIGKGGDIGSGTYSIRISGTKYASYTTGGVVGMIVGQYVEIYNATVSSNIYGSPYANYGGGIVGAVGSGNSSFDNTRKSVVKITDVATSGLGGGYNGKHRGGIVGFVFSECMLALDGDIKPASLGAPEAWGGTGHIAGGQYQGLIYLEETANYVRPAQSAPAATPSNNGYYYDDIGNYGGVYKNKPWGDTQGNLFSYAEFTTNPVKGTVTTSDSGDEWQIDSEADLIRLAIMLNSEGKFAGNCFNGTPKADLLKANYKVTKSLDLTESGVYCLNRNDYLGFTSSQAFTGHFTGTGSDKVTINLGDLKTRQSYVALFPWVGSGAEISGFTLKRTIYGANQYAAGIAAYSSGTFTAKDLYIDLTPADNSVAYGLKGYDSNDYYRYIMRVTSTPTYSSSWSTYYTYNMSHYYGGLVAYVAAQDNTTFTVENVKVNGWMYADSYYYSSSYWGYIYMGGMVAYYTNSTTSTTTTSTISVNNFELMEKFRVDSAHAYKISGMITEINYGDSSTSQHNKTTLSMKNIQIHDGAQITATGSTTYASGGWLGHEWKNIVPDSSDNKYYSIDGITIGDGNSFSDGPYYTSGFYFGGLVETVTGRIQLKNINIKNARFRNASTRTGIGLLFRIGNDAIIEIDGYTIDGRPIGDTTPSNTGNVRVENCDSITVFDEIVAYNIGTSTNGDNNYTTGGIVNIIYNGFANGNHNVYHNRLLKAQNSKKTRYYYNLFGKNFEDGYKYDEYLGDGLLTSSGTTVTNPNKMMIWHLTQYMNNGIRRFLSPYYGGANTINDSAVAVRYQNTTFEGTIDLKSVSYYPTPVRPGSGTTVLKFDKNPVVIFYGDEIKTAAKEMTASSDQIEHYMMHAGLFLSQSGNVTVKGAGPNDFLRLKGSITFLPADNDLVLDNPNSQAEKEVYQHTNLTGAVFAREIKDEKSIYRIIFDNLHVTGYADMTAQDNDDPTGLMLAIVKDNTTLDISWIETQNYAQNGRHAASALIGLVGNVEAKKISIEFKNMRVDGTKVSENGVGSVFRYASFIDEHYYVEDTEEQSKDIRRVRYLFTQAAFKGEDGDPYSPFDGNTQIVDGDDVYGDNEYSSLGKQYVTIGYELWEGIEYWDFPYGPNGDPDYTGNSNMVKVPFLTGGSVHWVDETNNDIEEWFIPYVHTQGHTSSKDIEVNPKNKSITKGCGTYEDPYIIDNPKQLLALARYLQNKDDYKYLDHWMIHEFESGRKNGQYCTQNHPEYNSAWTEADVRREDSDLKIYRVGPNNSINLDPGFPTQEELSQAYYMITCDINMSVMGNATDRVIAETFAGLGTKDIPFRGVIIGAYDDKGLEDRADGDAETVRPQITLPRKSYWTATSGDMNHGLIQYAIGAVVKDLRIQDAEDDKPHEKTGVAKVKKMAGGVMADIIGGDNIIDNVTVDIRVAVQDSNCSAGAYVGTVEQGSLILRNLPADCASGFEVGTWSSTANNGLTSQASVAANRYVSGLIGKVEDGCVIYDDTTGSGKYNEPILDHAATTLKVGEKVIYDHSQTSVTNGDTTTVTRVALPICEHYDIIVKSRLDAETLDKGKDGLIKVNKKSRTADDDKVNGARDHFVATVANSSQLQIVSMVINSDAFSVYPLGGGYRREAACRKASYKYVGKVIDNHTLTSDATKSEDFTSATTNDDKIYYDPYLYQYFDFTEAGGKDATFINDYRYDYKTQDKTNGKDITATDSNGRVSKLNMPIGRDNETDNAQDKYNNLGIKEMMDYELVGTEIYNLSQYCRGFRGIGATYGMWTEIVPTVSYRGNYDSLDTNAFYSDFRANFNGNGATIELGIDKGYDPSIHTAALFNDLMDRKTAKDNYYTIENFTVTGTVISNDGSADGNAYNYPNRTAAIAGLMRRPWKMSKIIVDDMTVDAKGNAGGLVAWIEPGTDNTIAHNSEYEFENCTLMGDTKIHAYAGSVGGMIGIVSQNEDTGAFTVSINLNGCKVKGNDRSEPVEIAVKNRTLDRFEGSTSSSTNYSIQRGVGRSGGFIGYVGIKYSGATSPTVTVNIGDASDGSRSMVSYADITGAYSTGGLIGAYNASTNKDSTVNIQNVQVANCEIEGTRGNYSTSDFYYTYGVGGLIGEMYGYWLQITSNDNVEVLGTNINASQNNSNQGTTTRYGMYAGGVVGCLKTANENVFKNVEVSEPTVDDPNLELGGQQYVIRSGKVGDVGGFIGRAVFSSSSTIEMSGVKVSGMYITADQRTKAEVDAAGGAFGTSNAAGGYVGGLIGQNQLPLTISGDGTEGSGATVVDCMITGDRYDVGGIIGAMAHQTSSSSTSTYYVRSTNMKDILVKDSIIGYNNTSSLSSVAYGAGGVYGLIDSSQIYNPGTSSYNSSYRHELENAKITGCWIYGPCSGGVLGRGLNYETLVSEGSGLSVDDNKIYGAYVGGVMGYGAFSRASYIGTQVTNNQLQATGNGSSPYGYVGGFVGYAVSGNNPNYRLTDLVINDNEIFAGNSGTSTIKYIGAGGLIGYNNWANSYIYQPTLTDNLIGFNDTVNGPKLKASGASTATLQDLFKTGGEMDSQSTAQLIAGTERTPVAMPSVADLRKNQIGYYAGKIGNYVGAYGTGGHTFILAPKLSYNENGKTIATRPVVDVGMTTPTAAGVEPVSDKLMGSPYAYRSYIHVIYFEPESTVYNPANVWNNVTINDSTPTTDNWKYLFTGINYDKVMETYRKTKEGDITVDEYLDAYRLNVVADADGGQSVESVYNNIYRDATGTLKTGLEVMVNGQRTKLPVVLLDTQYGTTDELMKGVVAALTGVGGVYSSNENTYYSNASGMGTITNITTQKMVIKADGSGNVTNRIESVASTAPNGAPSLTPNHTTNTSSNVWSIDYKDFDDDGKDYDKWDEPPYPELDQSFSMVTITYSWAHQLIGDSVASGRTNAPTPSVTIQIPVFVDERLNVDTHMKIVEGLQYNVETVKNEGLYSSDVVVANDSSYTLYMEYIYGRARTKYIGESIPKNIGFEQLTADGTQTERKMFAPGTKLTLIDVDDNNKVYYYTVQGNEHENTDRPYISFTDFKTVSSPDNSLGDNYKNKDISEDKGFKLVGAGEEYKTWDYDPDETTGGTKNVEHPYSDVAVERFLLTVDISGVKEDDFIESSIRDVDYHLYLTGRPAKKTTLNEHTNMQLRILEGIRIKFYQKNKMTEGVNPKPTESEVTWIEGKIQAGEDDGFVDIWGTIRITASPLYWIEVRQGHSIIDSANHNKYLELQVYLTEHEQSDAIFLPDNTFVSIEGERTAPTGITDTEQEHIIDRTALDPYFDTSNIYFYKDGSLIFRMNDVSEIIRKEYERDGARAAMEIRWADYLRLDFRNAEMQNFDAEKYDVHIDLLRIEDPNYPVGGELMDVYYRDLDAVRPEELACAVEAEDLMELGINTYDHQTPMPHDIHFDYKMDFNGVIQDKASNNNYDELAANHYTVAYRIWEKQFAEDGKTYVYVPYNGNQLDLKLDGDPGDQIDDENEKILERVDPVEGDEDSLLYWYTDYKFLADEIKDGTKPKKKTEDSGNNGAIEGSDTSDIEASPGVIIRDLTLTVNNAYEMDLSNYKVQAILYVSEEDDDGTPIILKEELDLDAVTTLSDFFIFTVAKLKTDLDY